MKNKFPMIFSTGQLEHRRGKKLGQLSTEFFHKKREVRKHRTPGFRGRKG